MSDTMKLTYFDARGRAEMARFLLVNAGVKYEDVRLNDEKWQELKPSTPKAALPIFEHKGNMLCESMAIARYIARETNQYGSNNYEAAVCDMMIDSQEEVVNEIIKLMSTAKTEEEKAEAIKKVETTGANVDKLVGKLKKGKFMLGDKISMADIALLTASEFILMGCPELDLSAKYPTWNSIVCGAKQDANIAKWLETRPKTKF